MHRDFLASVIMASNIRLEDLRFIYHQLIRRSEIQLDMNMPMVANEDRLREKVSQDVSQFVLQGLAMLAGSDKDELSQRFTIDGKYITSTELKSLLTAVPVPESQESRIVARQVQELELVHQELEVQVGKLRRFVPATIRKMYLSSFKKQVNMLDDQLDIVDSQADMDAFPPKRDDELLLDKALQGIDPHLVDDITALYTNISDNITLLDKVSRIFFFGFLFRSFVAFY